MRIRRVHLPSRRLLSAPAAVLLGASLAVAAVQPPAAATPSGGASVTHFGHSRPDVLPTLRRNLVSYYDFEHPVRGNPAQERDLGFSGTNIDLVNGGAAMRVRDGAYPASRFSVQTQQLNPTVTGNDDWKAGIWGDPGVPSLHAFNAVKEVTLMGWFKQTGTNPNLNTTTPDPNDFFNAVGLIGVLSGNSQGHDVRALLEVINVNNVLHVVALGRRVDGSSSQTFAANEDWQSILPQGKWVFLAATFDFDNATMALYKNGKPLDGFYTIAGDPWGVVGDPEPDVTTATDPRGIKIGGSFPQNTEERNPCNCRMDGLIFLNRVATPKEVAAQYRWVTRHHH
ncbi:MAG TPA: hypothetical protein VH912_23005 [Streptosporangiaceae bacterium]|jgi:hypothetical protein